MTAWKSAIARIIPILVCSVLLTEANSIVAQSAVQQPPWVTDATIEPATDETSRQLGMARDSFLMFDAGATVSQLRSAVRHLRHSAKQADDSSKRQLTRSADELDLLANRVERGKVSSVDELDRPSARAMHRLARHHYSLAHDSWKADDRQSAGKRMQAVADNLERAAALSGQQIKSATSEAIKDARLFSCKLVAGVGYTVDEVGKRFESLGRQIEAVGHGIDPGAPIRSQDATLPLPTVQR